MSKGWARYYGLSNAERSRLNGHGLEQGTTDLFRSLPKSSNVVPFGVCYGFLVRDCNILPKKELHRRVWVGFTV